MKHSFKPVIDLLFLAKQDGVEVVFSDDRLQLKVAENKKIEEGLLKEIRNNKQLIIEYLTSDNWKSTTVTSEYQRIKRFDRQSLKNIPLSFSQERLWFIDQLEGSLQYHAPTILRLKGKLDTAALSNAIKTIIHRHDILRTVFYQIDGHVFQSVKEQLDWNVEAIAGSEFKQDVEALKLYLEKLVKKPFDLANEYPVRASLIKIDENEFILVVTMHHIASDAWSVSIIVEELVQLYNSFSEGRSIPLLPLPLQYADYAVWQRNFLKGDILERKINYWKAKLAEQLPLQLPTDYTRPAIRSTRGSSATFKIDKQLSGKLRELSQQQESSMFMVLLAAFKVLLYRYSGQEDITVGTSVASRQQKELESLVGFFVNTLALRTVFNSHISFTELLRLVKSTTLEAYDHLDVPFEKVVEAVTHERDMSRSPLFQVMLVLQNTPEAAQLKLGELELSGEGIVSNISKFDLTFFISETPGGLTGTIEYSTDLFHPDTIARMMTHFETLLISIAAQPNEKLGILNMLTIAEQQQLLNEFNQSQVVYPKMKSIVDLFEEQVEKTPGNVAVVFEDEVYTYKQIDEWASQIARQLNINNISKGTLVPLYLDRSASMIAAMFGIMKAGAAYVPIDMDLPLERITYLLKDTGATIVLGNEASAEKLKHLPEITVFSVDDERLKEQSSESMALKVQGGDLAYVIYTSGSTGNPKGVMVTHGNLADYYYGLKKHLQIDQCNSFGLVSTIATDLGNTVIYSALLSGGALHVFSKESVSNIEYIHKYFSQHSIDCLKIVPSHWQALCPEDELLIPKKLLIFGGEALQFELIQNNRLTIGNNCRVINHYGPTETTIGKLLHEVKQNFLYNKTIPIGRPFSNTKAYVLSKDKQLCPIGVPGQLFISGDGLAKGYLNNENLTTEKFIDNPFDKIEYTRMYGTGDLVKLLPDGNIEFIGRIDGQVKIRGYRIELGEVESILQLVPMVSQVVVLAKDDKKGNKRLVAYIVAADSFNKEELIVSLKEKLPDYMVPSVYIELDELPLTANGKVARNALPDPESIDLSLDVFIAPRNETEIKLAGIWADVLELDEVGMNDDFFELGGHSLLAVRLISAIRKAFVVEMPIGDIFDYPTVALLAARLMTQPETAVMPAIEAVANRPEQIPLSFSQERLWFVDQLDGSLQYHIPTVLRLKGSLDIGAFSNAMQQIINRHEVLRTVFLQQDDGSVFQSVKNKDEWQLKILDGSFLSADNAALADYIKQTIEQPFNLVSDYMIRASLINLTDNDRIFIVTLHHIASDGWSTSIIVKELAECYNAVIQRRPISLPPLPIQYADYAIWQRKYLQGEAWDKKIDYWRHKLKDVTPLQLSTDFPRPLVQNTKGATTEIKLDKTLSEQIRKLSQQEGATTFMTLLTAFKILLFRYTGQQDICVGVPVAGRQQQELESLIGFFINTLALRSELDAGSTFKDLLQQVKSTTLEAYEHQDIPFEKVVETVVKDRDMSRSPLFQVMLILQNTPDVEELKLGDIVLSHQIEGVAKHHSAKFELTFNLTETNQGLYLLAEYYTELFNEQTIQKMMAHFVELLKSAVQNPLQSIGQLPMLMKEEELLLLETFNDNKADYPKDKNLIELFETQAAKTPVATALIFGRIEISFAELNERSNQLAHALRGRAIGKGNLVPVCISRSIEMVVGIIGILKSGAAYVPIDDGYPQDRISYMLDDIGATILVTNATFASSFSGSKNLALVCVDSDDINLQSKANLSEVNIDPEDLVCVLYTSGSSGRPKGVKLFNAGILNRFYWMWLTYPFESGERNALKTSVGFGDHIWELFGPLIKGIPSVIFGKDELLDLDMLVKKLAEEKISRWVLVPSLLKMLLGKLKEDAIVLPNLKYWTSSGETLPASLVKEFYEVFPSSAHKLLNIYGSSELTADVTCYDTSLAINDESTGWSLKYVPIGKPIANTNVYIVDKNGQLTVPGLQGEICVAGIQVAQGYLNLPELTLSRFLKDPFDIESNNSMFKTGDYGRWLSDGNIEYLGRLDDQVKIRGNRIELHEIETVLQQIAIVKQSVVLAKRDVEENNILVGYFVASEKIDGHLIINGLRGKVPEYMVPTIWIQLDEFPLTSSGKINKLALPEPDFQKIARNQYEAPRNETEATLVSIWQNLLHLDKVGINDNFFELGGHSLLAMRLLSAIRKELNVELVIKTLFNYPTVALLAEQLSYKDASILIPAITVQEKPDKIPLSFSQERLWFINQMGGSVQYHIPSVLQLRGRINEVALGASLQEIINRHEILRTVINEDEGVGYQLIMQRDEWKLELIDYEGHDENSLQVNRYVKDFVNLPFKLSRDYMLRAALIRLQEDHYILAVAFHHIASDGWSASIIVRELMELYNSTIEQREPILKPMVIQYSDYTMWQRNYLQGDVFNKKLEYWKAKLNKTAVLQLPTDYPRPPVQQSKGNLKTVKLDIALSDKIQSLCQEQGVTMFMTLLAAFNVLLHRYTGQEDVCIGTPIAGRQHQELEDLVGFFANSLALRSRVIGSQPFTAFLQETKITMLEAYDNQEVPFEKIVELVVKERDLSRSPLFQVVLVLQNGSETPEMELGGIKLTRGLPGEGSAHLTSKFDLTFNIIETNQGLLVTVEYCTSLYGEPTILRMIDHFNQLLQSIVANPQQQIGLLPMITATETQQLLVDSKCFYNTNINYKFISELFEEQVAKNPENIALVFEEVKLTYKQLNERSNQLANFLQRKEVNTGSMVAICMERSAEMMIGIIGILKAGATYVPIDPQYPSGRINFMLGNTSARMLITSTNTRSKLTISDEIEVVDIRAEWQIIMQESNENLLHKPFVDNLAVVIYTSGSTGKPKGVMVTQKNIVSLVKNIDYVSLGSSDVLLSTGSISFDATSFEYWGMLLNGGSLVLCTEKQLLDIILLKKEIIKHGVTHMWFTSSWFNELVDIDSSIFATLSTVLVGGEKLSEYHIEKFRQIHPGVTLINGYGPTENSTFSLTHRITETQFRQSVPIGKPLTNRFALVLDEFGQLAPIGIQGEIFLGGEGLTKGYLNEPKLTEDKFITHSFSAGVSERIYKTGDLGAWSPDGSILYLGRKDDQVKIRGFRIEPGEIEHILQQSEMVTQAMVLCKSDQAGNKYLAGYIIPNGTFNIEALVTYMKDKVPSYMIPSAWMELDHFPLTANGKVDKTALPHPDTLNTVSDKYEAPRNELEEKLLAIWQKLLGSKTIGVHDNFFELGGHSLHAIRLVSAIRKDMDIDISINDVFIHPTIAGLIANFIEKIKNPSLPQANIKYTVPIRTYGKKAPLYIVAGGGGTALKFKRFGELLDFDQPVYVLQPPIEAKDQIAFPVTIEGIAEKFIQEILIVNPVGPYALAGHCLGGIIAFEMAKQLRAMGKEISMLAMFDTIIGKRKIPSRPAITNLFNVPLYLRRLASIAFLKVEFESFLFRKYTRIAIGYKTQVFKHIRQKMDHKSVQIQDLEYVGLGIFKESSDIYIKAIKSYKILPIENDVKVFYAKERYYFTDAVNDIRFKKIYLDDATKKSWKEYASSVSIFEVDGDHSNMFESPRGEKFARQLQILLNEKKGFV